MKTDNPLKVALLTLAIVVGACMVGIALAESKGPPETVVNNEDPIAEYQKIIEKNRPAHEAFEAAKAAQAELERQNNALGWRTEWSTLKPVPIEPSLTSRL